MRNFSSPKAYYTILVLIFLSAFILRIWHIGQLDLWRDEAFSVILAQKDLSQLIKIAINDTTPPLLEIILHFWMKIFGNSELSVRLPSLVASLGTFFYMYFISKKFFKRYEVILILALFCFNIISIFYAREARAYALLTFFIIGSFYHLLNLINKFRKIEVLLFILFTTLAFYSHNLALFFIAAEIIYVFLKLTCNTKNYDLKNFLINNKRALIHWISTFLITFAFCSPWIILTIVQAKQAEKSFWLTFHPFHSINQSLTGLAVGIRLFTQEPFDLIDSILNLVIISATIIGTIFETKNLKKQIPLFTTILWIPYLLIYLISFVMPLLYMRYISFLAPFMVILMYKGLKFLFKKSLIRALVIGLIVIGNLKIYIKYINNSSSKPQYSQLVQPIKDNLREDDCVIHTTALSFFPVEYYADEEFESYIYDPANDVPFYTGKVLLTQENFIQDLTLDDRYDRVWTIRLETYGQKSLSIDLSNNFNFCEEKEFLGNLYLKLWVRNEKTCDSNSDI